MFKEKHVLLYAGIHLFVFAFLFCFVFFWGGRLFHIDCWTEVYEKLQLKFQAHFIINLNTSFKSISYSRNRLKSVVSSLIYLLIRSKNLYDYDQI